MPVKHIAQSMSTICDITCPDGIDGVVIDSSSVLFLKACFPLLLHLTKY